jgi:protoporphyrinogen oxidase
MSAEPHIVIIGAGPTGLGAAWRLQELGHVNWTLIDANDYAGGLATSFVDTQGFTWDIGGHVLFSHYKYFDRLMEQSLGDDWLEHEREAWVRMRDRWVPYPFQNNIWRLPEDDLVACVNGLLELQGKTDGPRPGNFREWLLQSFGQGLCDTFMYPYNFKVWAYDPATMDTGWMGERVAQVDLSRVLENLVRKTDDVGWGPNATFRFPRQGGTGAIWKSVYRQLPPEHIRLGSRVSQVNPGARTIALQDGSEIRYGKLISTMPVDQLLGILHDCPELSGYAGEFVHSSSHIVGIGLQGQVPAELATKCWMYFPEDNSPFYRVTVFSNYSPQNVPRPGEQWSLMCEVSESPEKPVDSKTVVEDVVQGLINCKLITAGDEIVSRWNTRLEYGYPTPWKGRDEVLDPVNRALTGMDIYSRGRFGTWKYEVSNQDHSVMQGVEAVNHILNGEDERTYYGDMSDS